MQIVIVSNKKWHRQYVHEITVRTGTHVTYIDKKDMLTRERLEELAPTWVFFPHWSYIISKDIYENYRCVVFHMTDLPFGRGGSPLQNLIARGIYETQISAIRCSKGLDTGDVYLKRPLSLWGTAEEIYLRAAEITKEMMIELVRSAPEAVPQTGAPVVFKRRMPEEGNIATLQTLDRVFDYIRMLDADTYPPAFLEAGMFRLEFSRASYKGDSILADVKITKQKE